MSKEKELKLEEEKLNESVEETQEDEKVVSKDSNTDAPDEDPIEQLNKQLDEEKGKYLRLYAEFENFRRRNAKERIDLIGTASADLIKEILPIMDDFNRAVESNRSIDDIDAVKEGFNLLQQKMHKILESKGLKAIDSVGQPFDAEIHEAVAQIPTEKAEEKGIIIDEIEKGYSLNEKIIRHPKVVVGS